MTDFKPIGTAHSPFSTPGAPPFQSAFSQVEGTIEIFPEYREGLMSIEGFSHLIILSCFDRATQRALTEQALIDDVAPHGIFACRHFNRPNPIGISYVELMKVTDGVLQVRGLDLLEGTPVLDIKPYIPAFDSFPDAVTGWVTPRHIEQIRETSTRAGQGMSKDQQHV
ncbi:MAG: tRNA (N6-threonylcarbamoyladenosine(37)-N6)-methyltransferase TrmO [Methanoregula sp.]|jgi:tRNA-Thr(GGU) m(6)t(6)A37 methyltransferase TsaA|uniref:tRNA (N6-threonylcarbamoyladenosine(37)-N6)-methyltransferase TrmO n=1 Tax=Methanoregula sp. TaxID=2052170 RepID=UPI0025F79C3A|nr:tRNA (N6-threonylcarbamoyladenosine(37)-N6)-methyltransferase TrmO [Methanoregula sp.]MCK9630666.1 tRNA (N6-threonylcarbamoyladenosine(37)-N6)-methyltransferase TrmO [Methanoregula sp.]